MTASQQAKAKGLSSLRQVSELTDVKERTLINWHKDRPLLFKVVLNGLSAGITEKENKNEKHN